MYKLYLFLKKTDDDQVKNHFEEFTLKYLSELAGEEIKAGKIESSLLSDQKFSAICEISASSKDEMDKMMSSPAGKKLNKDLMEFHQSLNIIFADYNN